MDISNEELRKLQLKEFEVLKELKRVCDANKISYFLFAGTLIGALRHKGFIPWDDDIDTCMTISNYHTFQEVCKTQLRNGFYLQTPESDPEAGLSYCKLRIDGTTLIVDYLSNKDIHHGINIDIYPLYNVSDNRFMRYIQYAAGAIFLLLQAQQIPKNHGAIMKFGSAIVLFLLQRKARERVKAVCYRYMVRYENVHTEYKSMMHGNIGLFRYLFKAEDFENHVYVSFEGEEFPAPIGYDDYLRAYYGNYMEMPPIEERGAKLKDILKVDTERSYLDYKGSTYCSKQ